MNENAKNLEWDEEFNMTEDEVMFRFNELYALQKKFHISKNYLPVSMMLKKEWLMYSIQMDEKNILR